MKYTTTKLKSVQHASMEKILLSTNIYSYTSAKRKEEKKLMLCHGT